MIPQPTPQDSDASHRIGSFVAEFLVNDRDGPMSSPERLAQQIRIELLPALTEVFGDRTVAVSEAQIAALEIDLGQWPADPHWPDVRREFRTRLLAALAPYLRPLVDAGAGSVDARSAQNGARGSVEDQARQSPLPPGSVPRFDDGTVVPFAQERGAPTLTPSAAHLPSLVAVPEGDVFSTLRRAAEVGPAAFDTAVADLPDGRHRRAVQELLAQPGATPGRGMNRLQVALRDVFTTAGHSAQHAERHATLLTARLLLHPVGANALVPDRVASRLREGTAGQQSETTGHPVPLADGDRDAELQADQRQQRARDGFPERSDSTENRQGTAETAADLRAKWATRRDSTLAALRMQDASQLLHLVKQIVPQADPGFFAALGKLQSEVAYPQAAILTVLLAVLDSKPVDLDAVRQAGETPSEITGPVPTVPTSRDTAAEAKTRHRQFTETPSTRDSAQQGGWATVFTALSPAENTLRSEDHRVDAATVAGQAVRAEAPGEEDPTQATFRHHRSSTPVQSERPEPDVADNVETGAQTETASDPAPASSKARPEARREDTTSGLRSSQTSPHPIGDASRSTVAETTDSEARAASGDVSDARDNDLTPHANLPDQARPQDGTLTTTSRAAKEPARPQETKEVSERGTSDTMSDETGATGPAGRGEGDGVSSKSDAGPADRRDAIDRGADGRRTGEELSADQRHASFKDDTHAVKSAKQIPADAVDEDKNPAARFPSNAMEADGTAVPSSTDFDAKDAARQGRPAPAAEDQDAPRADRNDTHPSGQSIERALDGAPPHEPHRAGGKPQPPSNGEQDAAGRALFHSVRADAGAPDRAAIITALASSTFGRSAAEIAALLDMIWEVLPEATRASAIAGTEAADPVSDISDASRPRADLMLALIARIGPTDPDMSSVLHHLLDLLAPDPEDQRKLLRMIIARLSYPVSTASPAL
ncbi:MAG: hypothetical protein AAGA94_09150, partial [Pseudomonadota bacterium]